MFNTITVFKKNYVVQVTPRKRFRCPECVTESLWADPSHFVERSECLNEFVRAYGHMPLETVEFRADPLLFGEKMADRVKLYRDIGSIQDKRDVNNVILSYIDPRGGAFLL